MVLIIKQDMENNFKFISFFDDAMKAVSFFSNSYNHLI